MNNFIGIDGGGTSTRCVLTNEYLEVIADAGGGASNPLIVGFDNSTDIIFRLIKNVCNKSGIKKNINIVAGIAGCGSKTNSNKLKQLLLERIHTSEISVNFIEVVNDAQIALEGALNGKPGTIIIAGTGSVLLGKDNSKKLYKIGGYGKLIGDEGSGYSIGLKGLKAVSKYFDGRGKKTKLVDYLASEYGIINRDEMITKVYSRCFDIADVSKHVLKAADKRDKVCMQIITKEIKELILHIKAFKKNIKEKKIVLSFAGSLLTNKNYYSRKLKREITGSFKNIKIIKAKYPPVIGAVILAKKLFTRESL